MTRATTAPPPSQPPIMAANGEPKIDDMGVLKFLALTCFSMQILEAFHFHPVITILVWKGSWGEGTICWAAGKRPLARALEEKANAARRAAALAPFVFVKERTRTRSRSSIRAPNRPA